MFQQKILTPQGEKSILDVKVGQEVIGYNYTTKQQEVYIVSQKGPFGRDKAYLGQDGKYHYRFNKNQYWVRVNRKWNFAPHQSIYANGVVVHAFELKMGDVIENEQGKKIMVSCVERIKDNTPKILLSIENKKTFFEKISRRRPVNQHTYYINGILCHNGSRYWVGGSATWDGTAGSKWAATDGGASGSAVPTAADDVFLTALSGANTVTTSGTATDLCRSLNCTGFTGTLSHAAGTIITIGDATAGASNVALKLVAGMTYTLGNATTSEIDFVSTSATVQTVDFASKITGNVVLNASSNGSWQLTGTWGTSSVNGSQATTLTKGTLDTNGQTIHWGRFDFSSASNKTITLGASTINLYGTNGATRVWNGAATGVTFNANTSTISMKTALAGGLGAFTPVGLTYNNITVDAGGSNMDLGGGLTCANLTVTGSTNKTDNLVFSGSTIVTNTFTVNGNSSVNRILIRSSVFATQRSISAATVSVSNVDLQDISGIGAGSWNLSAITGNSGDCGGNSNITFTTGASQTWAGTSGGNWSANAWTSRVPLPQDDVVISSAFSASQTITNDMPRVGKSINWTGSSGSPVWSFGSVATTMFGSLTLIAGMSITGVNGMTFAALTDATITSNGIGSSTLNTAVSCRSGATISLADNWATNNGVGNFQITAGGFNSNNFTITCNLFQTSGTLTRSITLGTSTINLTGTGAGNQWNIVAVTGLTFSGASSTVVYSRTSASTRVFAGGGLTYGTLTYTVAGSTGILQITGSNTFNTINFSDVTNARTLQFTAATTTTVAHWNVFGTSGKLMTVNSITAASQFNLKNTIDNNSSFCAVQDSNANQSGGIPIVNTNGGVDNGNNSYWIFRAFSQELTETVTHTDTELDTVGRTMTETVTNSDTLLRTPARTLTDTVSHTDSILRSLGRTISEIVQIKDDPGYFLRFDGAQNYLAFAVSSWANQFASKGLYIKIRIRGTTVPTKFLYGKKLSGNAAMSLEAFFHSSVGQNVVSVGFSSNSSANRSGYIVKDVLDGLPHVIEVVYQGSNALQLYVDGNGAGYVNGANQGIDATSDYDDFRSGYNPEGSNGVFDIDYLELGTAEAWPTVTKVAEFFINTGTGTTITDSTGHGNTATLTGSPLPNWLPGTLSRTIIVFLSRTISDTASLVDTVLKAPGHILSDTVSLTDTITRQVGKVLSDTLTNTDTILRSVGRTLVDTVTHSDTFSRVVNLTWVLTETVTLTGSMTRQINKVLTETLSLVDRFLHRIKWYRPDGTTWYSKKNTRWEE
jgi:hypothetical protein